MAEGDFWNDQQAAQKVINEANQIKAKLNGLRGVSAKLEDAQALAELYAEEESGTAGTNPEVVAEVNAVAQAMDDLEVRVLLAGELDDNGAIVSFNAGAGGTEACDWAAMLIRLYQRYAERNGWKWEEIDFLPGEEAGVKSATFRVEGEYAYGKLKAERGTHRLVRISPFNSAGKRQTSFAAVDVTAEIDDEIDIEIPESDLEVSISRSGGPGGQGVNTTDSKVTIKHKPTGLMVVCQNERSQIKNRATAMKVLKSRLYQIELDKRAEQAAKENAEKGEIGWGHQIRSYVFQPYQMVKDLRTGEQSSDIQGVMDGKIEPFIGAFLKGKKRSDSDTED